MKQLYQLPGSGEMRVAEVPVPQIRPGFVLVRVEASLVSAGTERTAVEFAQKNLLEKAKARPDLVRQVIDKARREGVLTAYEAATRKLNLPQSLGYSCAGTVVAVGEGVADLSAGDRVACAGAGYAVHAEVVSVPRNLVVPLASPTGTEVTFEDAAFTTLGAIAMHGVRLGELQLGETVAVIGLGLLGLLAVQLLKSAGCIVVGTDPNESRCRLALDLGCAAATSSTDEFTSLIHAYTRNMGADAVVITAAAPDSGPVTLAAKVARHGARVVAVGAVGTEIPRKPYYEKELDFRISRSYGPGRYDPQYEEQGHDYPVQYVRWTENRNMAAFVRLVADGQVRVAPLITHRFEISDASRAYDLISGKVGEPFLGVVIRYSGQPQMAKTVALESSIAASGGPVVAVLGAGQFASGVLLPALKAAGANLHTLCTNTGITASHAGTQHGFRYASTEPEKVLASPEINAVVIATRHHLHAVEVISALQQGKHVFCEKPLCIRESELRAIVDAKHKAADKLLMVGFNRRFSPMAAAARDFFAAAAEPLVMHYRVNAGTIPLDNWIQDEEQGGGRIVGEMCHFVDLLTYLAGAPCVAVHAMATPNGGRYRNDNLAVLLTFANGSVGNIVYAAGGDRSAGKERLELFGGGAAAVLDDFRSLDLVRDGRRTTIRARLRQDKGHNEEIAAFLRSVREGGAAPIPFDSIVNTTLATFRIVDAIRSGQPQAVQFAESAVSESGASVTEAAAFQRGS